MPMHQATDNIKWMIQLIHLTKTRRQGACISPLFASLPLSLNVCLGKMGIWSSLHIMDQGTV